MYFCWTVEVADFTCYQTDRDKSSLADMQDFSRLLLLLAALSFKAAEAQFEEASPVFEEVVRGDEEMASRRSSSSSSPGFPNQYYPHQQVMDDKKISMRYHL